MPYPTASSLSLFHWPHWLMLHLKLLSWQVRNLKPIWNIVFEWFHGTSGWPGLCFISVNNKSSAGVYRSCCMLCFTPKALFTSMLDAGKQERSDLQSYISEKDTSALVFNNFQLSYSLQSVNVFQDTNQLSFQRDTTRLQDRCCYAFLTFWKRVCNQ